jgi:hypothetical protein
MNEQEVLAFAESAKVKLTEQSRKGRCVDGRYAGDESMPMIAKPGGDAGDVMAAFGALNVLNLQLPHQDVLAAVIDVIGGPQNFQFHSDQHAEDDGAGPGMGCGHIKKAILEPEDYAVTAEQMAFIKNELPKLLSQGAHQEILQGNHAEQVVVVVQSESYGLKPMIGAGENLQEAFIYQQTIHQEQMGRLAKILQEKLAGAGHIVEEFQVQKALDEGFGKQLSATLKRLAEGLPVYSVQIDEVGQVTI